MFCVGYHFNLRFKSAYRLRIPYVDIDLLIIILMQIS
uniref:Uncharacterized protein n=1 Tax=Arundo donax TaxID=35708 RepID=A0A0A9FF36_ARUDO